MRTRAIKNVPASVHRRLLNLARSRDTQLNFLLQSYAAERFLYRLGQSPVSDRFTTQGRDPVRRVGRGDVPGYPGCGLAPFGIPGAGGTALTWRRSPRSPPKMG